MNKHEVRLQQAIQAYQNQHTVLAQSLQDIDPDLLPSAGSRVNLGVMWRVAANPQRAVECYRSAMAHGANDSGVWTNLGNALKDLKALRHARLAHEVAVSKSPESATAWYNYGITLANAALYAEAIAAFNKAVALPHSEKLNINWELARCHLALGDYKLGWSLFASRWMIAQHSHPHPHIPAWDGSHLKQGRLLLWTEQGFGDTIQCLRFLPYVVDRLGPGSSVVVAIKQELLELVRSNYPDMEFVVPDQISGAVDVQASLLDLPGLFCEHVQDIPFSSGYLRETGQNKMVANLRTRYPKKLLVGVVWTGSLTFAGNADRALCATTLIERIALPGVQLVSLQKGAGTDESEVFQRYQVFDLAPHLHNFQDTANAIRQLDLVIMTDSSVAHLCGALGAPVWVLLSRPAHWLWMSDSQRSAWYDSMRLFRQVSAGYWNDPLDEVSTELQRLLNQRHFH